MNVITLGDAELEEACRALAGKIAETEELVALIGVRTGGAQVASLVFRELCKPGSNLKYFEAGASRPTSAAKKTTGIKGLLSCAPLFIRDWLRVIEYYLVSLRLKLSDDVNRSVIIEDKVVNELASLNAGRLFVVDDAIDSGATVKVLLEKLHTINPLLEYKVAVLVVTQDKPLVVPDISIYQRVLLRFPWSSDYTR